MEKNNITFDLVKIISSETTEEFIKQIEHILHKHDIYAFRIWDVRGNVCEPCSYIPSDLYATFDIYELGFKNEDFSSNINIDISYFDVTYHIDAALFFKHNNRVTHVITFERPLSKDVEEKIRLYAPYFGRRSVELFSKERQMDLYIDYQKKVDFVKRASTIFMAIELQEVISMSLSFFMEVFSADAVCVYYNDEFYGIGLEGKKVAVIGRSLVVGKPVSMMLLDRNAAVTMCHSRVSPEDLVQICKNSDIIISAAGRINTVTADHVSGSQTIIDVGINFDPSGKMCGDADMDDIGEKASAITPVPGGVGSVTTALLMYHVAEAAEAAAAKQED